MFLALDTNGEVLTLLPVDFVPLGVVVDEVAAVPTLVLVEVGLRDGLVGEVLVVGKLEDEAETGLVEVLHADVGQVTEGNLVTVRDHLSEGDLVLHGRQPELGDAIDTLGILGGLLLLLGLLGSRLLLVIVLLTSLNLGISGLSSTVDDGGTLLVKRGELGKVLLLQLEHLLLELCLQLGVLLLDTLQARNATADRGREGLNVARGAANQRAQATLNHIDQGGVLGEDRCRSGTLSEVIWGQRHMSASENSAARAHRQARPRGFAHSPSLILATPGC